MGLISDYVKGISRQRAQKAALMRRDLCSLGQEIGLAFFRGRNDRVEPRHAAKLGEHGVGLEGIVSTIFAFDAALEQPERDVVLPTEGIVGCSREPVLRVGICQILWRTLFGKSLYFGRRRVVETCSYQLIAVDVAQFFRYFPRLHQVASAYEMADKAVGDPKGSNIELKKIHFSRVIAHACKSDRAGAKLIVSRVER